ncbi:MAG: hypothetical protein KAT05_06620, partial [Spirochaetes bacterium]|nr:hypothetical protein [Spirochaetota bacterium]
PVFQSAYYNLAYAYFKMKDYNNSLSWFRKYVDNADTTNIVDLSDSYIRIGDIYFLNRDYKNAVNSYSKAVDLHSVDYDYALFQKGFSNGLLKNYDYKIEERSEKDILAKTYNKLSKSIESNINEIQGYREHLEQLVIERTAELESANQELKDFAYIVSHDLKAPLRAITQLATWLSTDYKNSLDEKGKEQMDLLIGRAKRMNNLIDGILQYSRVGRIKGIEVEINLDNVLSEIIEMISPPKNIKITVQNELPLIIGDKTRIEQVFQNLIGNAIKFMDKPDGNINIGFSDEDSYWKFWVSDNGIGIDEKHYDKVFQIFQTLISRDVKESTGIGLSIVHKIVEMYGGKIWVESKLGKGSTFYFTLLKKGILKL